MNTIKEYYWQHIVDKTVTKTRTSRRPSRLHKRITKGAYLQATQPLPPAQEGSAG